MNILSIDSCSAVATGAVLRGEVLAAEWVINDKKTHSVKLLPMLEQMLQAVDMEFADIDLFAVTTGPGSFTGQRIGVATAKALAHATGKPIAGVSALKAMAYNMPGFRGLVCPIMDARRGQVYTALFRWEDGRLITVKPDCAAALEALLAELSEDVLFLGDGVPVFFESITATLGRRAHFAPPHLLHLRGGSVALCARDEQHKACGYSAVVPSYLRLSQAEREYNDRNRK